MKSTLLSLSQMGVVAYCADECRRQESGEMSVLWMLKAYQHLAEQADFATASGARLVLTSALIEELYALVEPEKNKRGYRQTNVVVAGKPIGWENIPRQMDSLVSAQTELSPVEFYTEFELIHAGADGNGRVGSLLYNFLSGSLGTPVAPPDVFNVTKENDHV